MAEVDQSKVLVHQARSLESIKTDTWETKGKVEAIEHLVRGGLRDSQEQLAAIRKAA